MDRELAQEASVRMQAPAGPGKGGSPPWAGRSESTQRPRKDPMSEYPEGCTLAIEGIPFHASESTFLPALVTCFGKWSVPNTKVIAVNIFRQVSHHSEVGGTHVNAGHMFIRFSEVRFMREV